MAIFLLNYRMKRMQPLSKIIIHKKHDDGLYFSVLIPIFAAYKKTLFEQQRMP
ncbi:hypothetical protein HMPREF9141_0209 [Prevotella multiformis DSM 16608]|uniref:Uncharacterized protein n=1 Tax=Prevotella multiformis DSM 16608 TaxID=888743 RepID=F0F3P3_9BACT|nr:hypothetical protein HMPREF9141_0209 [Prevotella multiformis DSM 16608]